MKNEKTFKYSARPILIFFCIFVVTLVLGALLFLLLNEKSPSENSMAAFFKTASAGDAGGFLQGVWGTAGSLAAAFVAIVLAQQALALTRKQNEDQDRQVRREQEQMRFNAQHEISKELSQIFASVAAFDVALDLAFRRSGELANQMMVSMGIAAHDYLRLTAQPIVESNGEEDKIHDHALLMAQYVKRDEFDERLSQVKAAIGMMADALNKLLENGVAATAYRESSHFGQTLNAQGVPHALLDLIGVISLLRNKAESRISNDQLVRMWFLALAPDRELAVTTSSFNEKYILPYDFLKNAANIDRNIAERSWALLGSLIGTVRSNVKKERSEEEMFHFTNFGLIQLRGVCARLPSKQMIRKVIAKQHGESSELLKLYLGSIDSWPHVQQERVDLSRSVNDHLEILSGSGQGVCWDLFREISWQFAAIRISTFGGLSLNLSRKMISESKELSRRDELCRAVTDYFSCALRMYRVPVSEVVGPDIKLFLGQRLFDEASIILRDLIHSPWFRGGLEARRSALNAAEDFFSWLILYKADVPNFALQLAKIDSCRSSLEDESQALQINRLARAVFVDQACLSQSVVQRRVASNEPFESILRSFLSLIGHIEELATLDGDLILSDDVVKLCNALNGLTQYQGFDERYLCEDVIPRLLVWKGNPNLLNKDTDEFISALDNRCMAALF